MNSTILGLLAETSIHPGAGQDTGFVDLPVAREAATDYPVIVGSSLKGALRDLKYQVEYAAAMKVTNGLTGDEQEKAAAKKTATSVTEQVFGRQENAGNLLVSDARLVLLPVRSLTSHYKWVTCPHLLERLERDRKRADSNGQAIDSTGPDKGQYQGTGPDALYLEEREFKRSVDLPAGVIDQLSSLIAHQEARNRLKEQVVILHNDDFAWFARYGLAINARNKLDPNTKVTTGGGLWYEETIPPDSLFYCLLAERGEGALNSIRSLFANRPFLQVGGNETVGQGWFAVTERTGGAE